MLMAPVGMASIGWIGPFWPRRMIDPLPNCFSIWPTAQSTALIRSRSWRSSRSIGGIRYSLLQRGYSKDVPSESQAQQRALPSRTLNIAVTYEIAHFRPQTADRQNLQ